MYVVRVIIRRECTHFCYVTFIFFPGSSYLSHYHCIPRKVPAIAEGPLIPKVLNYIKQVIIY